MSKSKSPSKSSRRWWLGWICFGVYNALVIYTSTLPSDAIPPVITEFNDLVVHVLAYFFLFFFSANAFAKAKTSWIASRPPQNALLWCGVIGGLIEWAQVQVPGRYASWLDWVADLLGAVIGLVVYRIVKVKKVGVEVG